MGSATVTVTAENFQATIEKPGIVLLDFWASWCGPCLRFAPTFEAAAEKHSDVVFGKIDTEDQRQLSGELQIQGIPTLMIFRDNILLFREAGALPPAALEDLIQQVKGLDMDSIRAEIAKREPQTPQA
jgi:thioredoxin 1